MYDAVFNLDATSDELRGMLCVARSIRIRTRSDRLNANGLKRYYVPGNSQRKE